MPRDDVTAGDRRDDTEPLPGFEPADFGPPVPSRASDHGDAVHTASTDVAGLASAPVVAADAGTPDPAGEGSVPGGPDGGPTVSIGAAGGPAVFEGVPDSAGSAEAPRLEDPGEAGSPEVSAGALPRSRSRAADAGGEHDTGAVAGDAASTPLDVQPGDGAVTRAAMSIPVSRDAEARVRAGDGLPAAARRAVDRWLAATRAAPSGEADTDVVDEAGPTAPSTPGVATEAPPAVESTGSGALESTGHESVPVAGTPGRMGAAVTRAAPAAFADALAASTADDSLAPQLVQALHVQLRGGVSEARVQLRPEHLGAVTIELRVEHGQVAATIRAETPQVAQWIESNQQALRQALADHGLALGRFAVNPDGTAPDGDRRESGSAPRRRPVPAGRDAPPRFEVVV